MKRTMSLICFTFFLSSMVFAHPTNRTPIDQSGADILRITGDINILPKTTRVYFNNRNLPQYNHNLVQNYGILSSNSIAFCGIELTHSSDRDRVIRDGKEFKILKINSSEAISIREEIPNVPERWDFRTSVVRMTVDSPAIVMHPRIQQFI